MSFDLNIDNYTRDELLDMFELPKQFDYSMLNAKQAKLESSIRSNLQLNSEVREQTMLFLMKARGRLMQEEEKSKPVAESDALTSVVDTAGKKLFNLNRDEYGAAKLESTANHMLIDHPYKPYMNTSLAEFYRGVYNPIAKTVLRKNITIDSRFRDNYFSTYSSNFMVYLPFQLTKVVQLQLTTIELPVTYYVVSKQYNNNFFTLVVNGMSTVVDVPSGNYTQTTIMNIINTLLGNAGPPFSYIEFVINVVGATTGTGQTLVGVLPDNVAEVTSLELNFQQDRSGGEDRNTPLPLKLGWMMGFRNGNYINNLAYVSEAPLDVTGPRYAFLVFDDFNKNFANTYHSALNNSMLSNNILARVTLQSQPFQVLTQNNLQVVTIPRDYLGPVNISNINIQLVDEYGRILDLNFCDFSFSFNVAVEYFIG